MKTRQHIKLRELPIKEMLYVLCFVFTSIALSTTILSHTLVEHTGTVLVDAIDCENTQQTEDHHDEEENKDHTFDTFAPELFLHIESLSYTASMDQVNEHSHTCPSPPPDRI